jgi:hypothetical protein
VGYFCSFSKKLLKENNRPPGENWPNLVTLFVCKHSFETMAGMATRHSGRGIGRRAGEPGSRPAFVRRKWRQIFSPYVEK